MGLVGLIDREINDNGGYEGINTGWSPMGWSSSYGNFDYMEYSHNEAKYVDTIRNAYAKRPIDIENIEFAQVFNKKTMKRNKNLELSFLWLIGKWDFTLHIRKRYLCNILNTVKSEISKKAIINHIREIEKSITILKSNLAKNQIIPISYHLVDLDYDRTYLKTYCSELQDKLLRYIKHELSNNLEVSDITSDLRSLSAVIMNLHRSDGTFFCSPGTYLEQLKNKNLRYIVKRCKNPYCVAEIQFPEFDYCLLCGKRKNIDGY